MGNDEATQTGGKRIGRTGSPRDLTGRIYGRLTVTEKTSLRKGKVVLWRCRCDCGGEKLAPTHYLNAGKLKSCGCMARGPRFRRDGLAARRWVHDSRSREYSSWKAMRQRCCNPNDQAIRTTKHMTAMAHEASPSAHAGSSRSMRSLRTWARDLAG
jgi:hypothetical protein